jgi:hypothetical protein
MLRYLLVKGADWTGYVDGLCVLGLLEERARQAPATSPATTGQSREARFNLNTGKINDWLGFLADIRTQNSDPTTLYMELAGRLLMMNQRFYVFDAGSVASATNLIKDGWNDAIPPTYRELAKRITEAKLNTLKKTQEFSQGMRNLLRGEPVTASTEIKDMLAVLTGAMFLAEPRRNAKAFALNLMLLDFAEMLTPYGSKADKYFTWDKILWHPEALNVDSAMPNPGVAANIAVKKAQQGPTNAAGAVEPIEQVGGLHRVGGKMPASPTGGATGGNAIKSGVNYIHLKEISVLVRWLGTRNQWEMLKDNATLNANLPLVSFNAHRPYESFEGPTSGVMTKIKKMLDDRLRTFNAM